MLPLLASLESPSSLVLIAGELGAFPSNSSRKSCERGKSGNEEMRGLDLCIPGTFLIRIAACQVDDHFPLVVLEWTWDHLMPDLTRKLVSSS